MLHFDDVANKQIEIDTSDLELNDNHKTEASGLGLFSFQNVTSEDEYFRIKPGVYFRFFQIIHFGVRFGFNPGTLITFKFK